MRRLALMVLATLMFTACAEPTGPRDIRPQNTTYVSGHWDCYWYGPSWDLTIIHNVLPERCTYNAGTGTFMLIWHDTTGQ